MQVGIDEGYFELQSRMPSRRGQSSFDLQQGLLRENQAERPRSAAAARKTVAKIASDFRKPAGLTVVPARAERLLFWRRSSCARCPVIGPRLEARLSELKLRTIGDLAALSKRGARAIVSGLGWARVARPGARNRRAPGRPEPADCRSRRAPRRPSRANLSAAAEMEAWIDRLSDNVWTRLEAHDLCARRATTKIRYFDFQTLTRSQTSD